MSNFTNITNPFEGANNFSSLLNVVNTNTGGWGYVGLMVMMQVILFMAFMPQFGFVAALMTSAFLMLISGMFLTYLGLMGWKFLMLFLGQILFSIIYITWQERNV